MQVNKGELTLIYNSNEMKDRKALVSAKTLPNHKLREIDIYKTMLTQLQVTQVAARLGVKIVEMIDKKSDIYKNELSQTSMDENDIMTAFTKNPSLMKTPIALYHNHAEFVDSSNEFINKDLETHANPIEKKNKL